MKTLHLIRHAKSSWEDPSLADIDRPLNPRGYRSCRVMAGEILKAGCEFCHVFCSPAVRAQLTIENIAVHLPGQDIQWQTDRCLYTFHSRDLLDWCRSLDDSLSQVVIVGHNPALTDLFNEVGDRLLKNLPTCAYARLSGEFRSWRDLSPHAMRFRRFLKPKMFL